MIMKHQKSVVKSCSKKKQPVIHQPNFKPSHCPNCKQNVWLEFDKEWYCQTCENNFNKQKHQIDKKSS